jgi:hypothetical protein
VIITLSWWAWPLLVFLICTIWAWIIDIDGWHDFIPSLIIFLGGVAWSIALVIGHFI